MPKCKKSDIKNLIINWNETHDNRYDYSKVGYINNKTKVKIICPDHGEFEQRPNDHNKYGCLKCRNESYKSKNFKNNFNEVHDNKYDYSKIEYVNNKTKVKIICPQHGEFEQRPDCHLQGQGCPKCNTSKGEKMIIEFLEKNNIPYLYQYKFENCEFKDKLVFDFYLPELNMCIEFDGIQHFKPIDYFGGYEGFKLTKKRDYIKNNFCEKENIKLSRIPYWENEINKKTINQYEI